MAWDQVKRDHVMRAIREYDSGLGPEALFAEHGFVVEYWTNAHPGHARRGLIRPSSSRRCQPILEGTGQPVRNEIICVCSLPFTQRPADVA